MKCDRPLVLFSELFRYYVLSGSLHAHLHPYKIDRLLYYLGGVLGCLDDGGECQLDRHQLA